MTRRGILAWALAALALAGPSGAGDTGLQRLTLRGDLLGWEGVGRLDLGDGFCTGALIAPDLVLTAAHCLLDRSGARRDPRAATFSAGLRDGTAVATRRGARAVLHPDHDPTDRDALRQLRSDLALVELARPIPAATAAPFAIAGPVTAGARVSVVSYARDRAAAPGWQRRCGVTGAGGGALQMTCDTHFGASGAPVFEMSDGRARIVSVISRGRRAAGESVVFGMQIRPALARLRRAHRRGEGVWPAPAVDARRVGAAAGRGDIGARFVRP